MASFERHWSPSGTIAAEYEEKESGDPLEIKPTEWGDPRVSSINSNPDYNCHEAQMQTGQWNIRKSSLKWAFGKGAFKLQVQQESYLSVSQLHRNYQPLGVNRHGCCGQ